MMQFIAGAVLTFLQIVLCGGCFLVGFLACSIDAETRLRGRKPVDRFWRDRGMK